MSKDYNYEGIDKVQRALDSEGIEVSHGLFRQILKAIGEYFYGNNGAFGRAYKAYRDRQSDTDDE
jgi:hypothetical protein